MVAGNDYGSTTETYLFAPFLAFWGGVWPLRVLPVALYAVAAYALYRLARPIFGRVPAAALALIGWTTSGALALMSLHAYMGYTTGLIAQVVALALACHAMRTEHRLARTAFLAGLAAGFAVWSHPIFGTVALLALVAPTLYRRRAVRRWWLPLAAGGLLGVSPWLLFMARNGWPESALPTVVTTYPERLTRFVTELLPRAFGLRTHGGDWVGPDALAVGVAALLILLSIVGMVVLVVLKGAPTVPILVAGLLAFPVLAMYAPLGSVADARYAMPFLPELLMGLGAWLLLIPERIRNSPWLLVTVPTAWALLLCVPVIHQQVGWEWLDPNADAKQVVSELESRQIRYVAGDYWGAYLVDYLADGRLQAAVHQPVRLEEENAHGQRRRPLGGRVRLPGRHDPAPADAGGPLPAAGRRGLGPVRADRVVRVPRADETSSSLRVAGLRWIRHRAARPAGGGESTDLRSVRRRPFAGTSGG